MVVNAKHFDMIRETFMFPFLFSMKLLICCATPSELKTVKTEIKKLHFKTAFPVEYLCTGIGNHLSIFHLTKFLTQHRDEQYFIINLGVCGYHFPEGKKSDFPCIQGSVIHHLSLEKEAIVPLFLQVAPLGNLISSDVIVNHPQQLAKFPSSHPLFIDMESWGIELVAQAFQLPRLFLKVPVDTIGTETQHFNRAQALEKLQRQLPYKTVIEKVLHYDL
ncbi:MAG: hypothetical protein LBP53_02905 [Candidatus Peribacteria bacterium]|jgi:nucleoside phosphorylase|nr:hypothetical protein [Candidatus Peribacteria bacterium]